MQKSISLSIGIFGRSSGNTSVKSCTTATSDADPFEVVEILQRYPWHPFFNSWRAFDTEMKHGGTTTFSPSSLVSPPFGSSNVIVFIVQSIFAPNFDYQSMPIITLKCAMVKGIRSNNRGTPPILASQSFKTIEHITLLLMGCDTIRSKSKRSESLPILVA